MDAFIDWESGRALFEESDFKNLLEFVNSVEPSSEYDRDEITHILEGRQLITHNAFPQAEFFVRFENLLDGRAVYKGFPSSEKHSGILFPMAVYAITSACEEKEAAWSFVRSVLLSLDTDRHQAFPSVQPKFDLELLRSMTEPKYGEPPMTPQQREKLMLLLDGVDTTISGHVEIRKIIEEEIPAYFAGQKSLDEVCAVIQSRAQIYVSEHY